MNATFEQIKSPRREKEPEANWNQAVPPASSAHVLPKRARLVCVGVFALTLGGQSGLGWPSPMAPRPARWQSFQESVTPREWGPRYLVVRSVYNAWSSSQVSFFESSSSRWMAR